MRAEEKSYRQRAVYSETLGAGMAHFRKQKRPAWPEEGKKKKKKARESRV